MKNDNPERKISKPSLRHSVFLNDDTDSEQYNDFQRYLSNDIEETGRDDKMSNRDEKFKQFGTELNCQLVNEEDKGLAGTLNISEGNNYLENKDNLLPQTNSVIHNEKSILEADSVVNNEELVPEANYVSNILIGSSSKKSVIFQQRETLDKTATTQPKLSEKEIEEILKKERLKAEWILQENKVKLIKNYFIAEKDSIKLRYLVFEPKKLLEAPTGLRETLVLLFGQMIVLHLSGLTKVFQTSQKCDLVDWAQNFMSELLKVLNLEKSPAISFLIEVLIQFIHEEDSRDKHEKFLNPQPVKSNWLSQCEVVYKDVCEKSFKNAILKEGCDLSISNTKFCSLSAPHSPKIFKPISKLHVSEETLKKEKPEKNIDISFGCPSVSSIILRDLLMICIGVKNYDARIQIIFDLVAQALDVQPLTLRIAIEDLLLCDLAGSMKHKAKESQRTKNIRRLKVAGVAVGLGALTALTAGLAAPAIAAGFGALGLAGTSGAVTFLSTIGGSAAMASLLGASSAGLTGWKYSRRIGKIKVFKFDRLHKIIHRNNDDLIESSLSSFSDDDDKKTSSTTLNKKPRDTLSLSQNNEPLLNVFKGEEKNIVASTESSCCSNYATTTEEEQEVSNTEDLYLKDIEKPSVLNYNDGQEKELLQKNTNLNIPSWSPNPSQLSLSVTICVSGWLRQYKDIYLPWKSLLCNRNDVYTLSWDPKVLLNLGNLVVTMLSQRFAVSAAQIWLQTTVAGALSTALMWPVAVLQYASTLDNAWMACKERAVQAGKLLADALCDRKTMGIRPVSLLGFSMGARVIFYCLIELKRRGAFHLIENVIVMGIPESCDKAQWQKARQVIAGRLINIFCPSDWLLGFLYRYMEWGVSVAGLSPVKVEGIENFDASGIIRNHNQYADKVEDLLAYVDYFANHQ